MGVFCFTSSHLRDAFGMDESQRVWCFILLEHAAVFIQLLMRHAIADVPEWVLQHRARDKYQLSLREHVIFQEEAESKDELSSKELVASPTGFNKYFQAS